MNKEQFYETPVEDFTFVPFDIETTGFFDTDIITTLTLAHNGTYAAWLNTDGRDVPDDLDDRVQAKSGQDVEIRLCDDDGELLSAVRRYICSHLDREDTIFVAYNGELWKGGFDIRFIRSVCLRTGEPFPFTGYAYTDLMPLFNSKDRFNVTHPDPNPDLDDLFTTGPLKQFADHLGVDYASSWNKGRIVEAIEDYGYPDDELQRYCDANGIDAPVNNPGKLVPVYKRLARLKGWPTDDCDPFGPDESERAVEAYHDGEFKQVLLHNIADVVKTDRLASLLGETRSIPKNEYQPTFY